MFILKAYIVFQESFDPFLSCRFDFLKGRFQMLYILKPILLTPFNRFLNGKPLFFEVQNPHYVCMSSTVVTLWPVQLKTNTNKLQALNLKDLPICVNG